VVIRAGCVYYVADEVVAMPPEQYRTPHDRNCDPDWPVVLICPVSSGEQGSPYDVKLGAGVAGLKKKGWVRSTLVQPLDKKELQECISLNGLPSLMLTEVHSKVLRYMDPPLEDL
jgi:mRNA-degrading endonuclease toxin of MazEF toxin-antitoxin module